MLNKITLYWTYVVASAGAVAAVTKFWLDSLKIKETVLRNKELLLKIEELERINQDRKSPIRKPTTEEIDKYGRPYMIQKIHRHPVALTGIVILLFLNIPAFFIKQTQYEAKLQTISEAHMAAEHESAKLMTEVANLMENLQKKSEALKRVAYLGKQLQLPLTASVPPDIDPAFISMLRDLKNRIDDIGVRIEETAKAGME